MRRKHFDDFYDEHNLHHCASLVYGDFDPLFYYINAYDELLNIYGSKYG
jgi:hypothetical protein